jgi:putative ABC transport system permease protein
MVVGEAMRPVLAGLALGAPLAFAAGQLSQSLLFEVRAGDSATYFAAITMLIASTMCAAILPARRAARIDPIVALRAE